MTQILHEVFSEFIGNGLFLCVVCVWSWKILRIQLLRFSICILAKLTLHMSSVQFSSVQSLSPVWVFVTPRSATGWASLFITNSQSLLRLTFIESVMPSNQLILCHPLLFSLSTFPSMRVFLNESVLCIRWPKYWSFSFSISPSNEYLGLVTFRMDWLDLQHHSSKASILWSSAFFMVQLTHPYMTTRKIIVLNRWTFVSK